MEPRTLRELFDRVTTAHPDRVAFQYKKNDRWNNVTWAEHRRVVGRLARALIAVGVERGDRACILGATSLEWVQADSALVCTGAVTVGIYHSNLAPDCAYIIDHSDAELIFVEDDAQLEKVLEVRQDLPRLRHVVGFHVATDEARGVIGWDDFMNLGERVPEEAVTDAGKRIAPDDLASIVYTSGTTGVPKGAMITHSNLVYTAWAAEQVLSVEPHYVTLMFLPLAHIYARMIAYMCQRMGLAVAFAEDIRKVQQNLLEVRPHFLISVPRIYEKIYEGAHAKAEAAGGFRKRLFDWALRIGWKAASLRLDDRTAGPILRIRHAIADRLVLRKVRDVFGGRMIWGASGAAPLNVTVAEFFHSCGIWVVEGLGMTENTSLSNANRLGKTKLGTVGPAIPGVEMKIAEDGEILFRGSNVMKGYFKNPEATAETITPDGWLRTGDIGEIDDDGFLRITDRKKDLIVTAGGKNVAPQRIEKLLRASPLISQAMAYGDREKYITALVTLAPRAVRRRLGTGDDSLSDEQLAGHPPVLELIDAEVRGCNEHLASYESVKKFRILPADLTIEGGELTPTLKVKRKVVVERNRPLIEEMYAD